MWVKNNLLHSALELGLKRMGSWPLKTAGPEHASAGNWWTSWLIEAISANQISEAKRLCYKWELETSFTWIMKVRRLVSQLCPETFSMPVEVFACYFGRSVTNGDRCQLCAVTSRVFITLDKHCHGSVAVTVTSSHIYKY